MNTDSPITNVFEYCKTKSNQRISGIYRTLPKNTKQEIYNLEYCNCLEKQYTNCLKRLVRSGGVSGVSGVSGCQSIVDEYEVQGK
jgi:hypothetical protein